MPIGSPRQYGAMQAALHGKGRLGIPRKVASEMVHKTPHSQRSAFSRALGRVRQKHSRGRY